MITVTPAARSRLAAALEQLEDQTPDDACFRIVRGQEDRLTLSIDTPNDDDVTIEESEKTILCIAPSMANVCADRTLDVQQSGPEGQTMLTLR